MKTTDFNPTLVQNYDQPGSDYASYPDLGQFHDGFDAAAYKQQVQASNDELIPRSLAVLIHIPFCETLCYYCTCDREISEQIEQTVPYMAALHQEIELQAELFDADRKVVRLHLGGGIPTYLTDPQLSKLMSRLAKHFNLPEKKKREWSIEVDPRTVNIQRIDLLAELGFNYLRLGVQDFDPQVQESVNRIHLPEHSAQLINRARKQGFKCVSIDLTYGLPRQTPASFAATIDKIIQLRPDRLSVYNYSNQPQLLPSRQPIKHTDLPSPETKLEMLEESIKRLQQAEYRHIGLDQYALESDDLSRAQDKGKLQRNLQGYATKAPHELLGLGVGAISQVANCYSQNHRSLAAYQATLKNHALPISRGLILRDEDRLRRAIIQQIMCQHKIEFAALSYKYHLDFNHHFAMEMELLEQLAVDGLVEIDALSLRVTPKGHFLLRPIARIFDQYSHQHESTQRVSRIHS